MNTRVLSRTAMMGFIMALSLGAGQAIASPELVVIPTIRLWAKNTVDTSEDIGMHNSIAFEGRTPWISYYDYTNRTLKVAHYVGSGGNCGLVEVYTNAGIQPEYRWNCETVDTTVGYFGRWNSIDVYRSEGFPSFLTVGVAYYNANMGELKYAHQHGLGIWDIVEIQSGPPLYGKYASLKYTDTGVPNIAYYVDAALGELHYAYQVPSGGNCGLWNASGKWHCELVDIGNGVGQYASLDYGLGVVYIAYYDGGNGNLKYAFPMDPGGSCGGGKWECITVDGTGGPDVGKFASIHAPTNVTDKLKIAYYDATNETLKYAEDVDGSSGNCGPGGNSIQCDTIETIGTMSASLSPISLAVYSNNIPIIAYKNSSDTPDLKVAQLAYQLGLDVGNCGPVTLWPTWQCTTIDPGSLMSQIEADSTSIAINDDGFARIAYSEGEILTLPPYSDNDLKIAWQSLPLFLPVILNP